MSQQKVEKSFSDFEVDDILAVSHAVNSAWYGKPSKLRETIQNDFHAVGLGGLRELTVNLTKLINLAFHRIIEDTGYDQPFDVEFVPELIAEIAETNGTLRVDGKTVMRAATKLFGGPEPARSQGMSM